MAKGVTTVPAPRKAEFLHGTYPPSPKLTPLTPGGSTQSFAGKTSQSAAMPDRRELKALASPNAGINDYAKATPMAQPAPVPTGPKRPGRR
jgi:hypothetical protein